MLGLRDLTTGAAKSEEKSTDGAIVNVFWCFSLCDSRELTTWCSLCVRVFGGCQSKRFGVVVVWPRRCFFERFFGIFYS